MASVSWLTPLLVTCSRHHCLIATWLTFPSSPPVAHGYRCPAFVFVVEGGRNWLCVADFPLYFTYKINMPCSIPSQFASSCFPLYVCTYARWHTHTKICQTNYQLTFCPRCVSSLHETEVSDKDATCHVPCSPGKQMEGTLSRVACGDLWPVSTWKQSQCYFTEMCWDDDDDGAFLSRSMTWSVQEYTSLIKYYVALNCVKP